MNVVSQIIKFLGFEGSSLQSAVGFGKYAERLGNLSESSESPGSLSDIYLWLEETLDLSSLGLNLANLGEAAIFYGKVAVIILLIIAMLYAVLVAFGAG